MLKESGVRSQEKAGGLRQLLVQGRSLRDRQPAGIDPATTPPTPDPPTPQSDIVQQPANSSPARAELSMSMVGRIIRP